jgi:hypothetical protein
MEPYNIDTILHYNTVKATKFTKLDFNSYTEISYQNQRCFVFKLDYEIEHETPMNQMYLQYINNIYYDDQNINPAPKYYPNYLSLDVSRFAQPEYAFTQNIVGFNAYIGNNRYKINQESFNVYPSARRMNYQNRKKNFDEYMLSTHLGLSTGNSFLQQLETLSTSINDIGISMYADNENPDLNTYNNFFRYADLFYAPNILQNRTLPRVQVIPLYFLDPVFDQDTCLPTGLKITLEFVVSVEKHLIINSAPPSIDKACTIEFSLFNVALFMTQYVLNKNVKNNLSRGIPIYLNSKRFEIQEKKVLQDYSQPKLSTDYFKFENTNYEFILNFNTLKPDALHFYVQQTGAYDNLNVHTYLDGSNLIYYTNVKYQRAIANGLNIKNLEISTSDCNIKLQNYDCDWIPFSSNGFFKLLSKDFYEFYGGPNYYSKEQFGINFRNPTVLTFLLNAQKQVSKDQTTNHNGKLSAIKVLIDYQMLLKIGSDGTSLANWANGPYNFSNDTQTLIFALEYVTKFIIDTSDNVYDVLNGV